MAIAVAALTTATGRGATPKFLVDDPIATMVDSQDASQVKMREIDLVYDTLENLLTKPGDPTAERPRAERQHRRRSARTRAGSRTGSARCR